MTYYLNLRAGGYGAVCSPAFQIGDPLADPPTMDNALPEAIGPLVRGKSVLVVSHGFNVSQDSGTNMNARLGLALQQLTGADVVFGALWPGDWAVEGVNYPFEDKIASHAGQLLGQFCGRYMAGAGSLSFGSHSLGARVILEAITALAPTRRVRLACIMAGAVGSKCLTEEYATAAANCERILTLSSKADKILEWLYPAGDFFGDLFDPDHPLFEPALGRRGPAAPVPANVSPFQIPTGLGYDHGDYLPPGDDPQPGAAPLPPVPPDQPDWRGPVGFLQQAFLGQPPTWPT